MTIAEKFKEVFGFYPDAYEDESVCNFMRCEDTSCKDCPYCAFYDEEEDGTNDIHVKWTDEYKGEEKVEERQLFYDPDVEQCFYLTMDEAIDHVNRNHDHYTGRFICGMHEMNPCLVMEMKGE